MIGAYAIATNPIATQGGVLELVIDDALHAHTADGVVLTQDHKFTVNSTFHSHTTDGIVISQVHNFTTVDALHDHLADVVQLSQVHMITVNDATHDHTADTTNFLLGLIGGSPSRTLYIGKGNRVVIVNNGE